MTTLTATRAPAHAKEQHPSHLAALIAVLALVCAVGGVAEFRRAHTEWPEHGQAALSIDTGEQVRHQSTHDHPAPIASLAKVMTAYVVLTHHPLTGGRPGYTMTVTAADVRDTISRRTTGQSTIPIRDDEKLSQRQALEALLLPSANNVARMLAITEAGSQTRFVAEMNLQAQTLGMADTHYTDPSGFEAATVSTASDQLILATAAMRIPAFAAIVARKDAVLPVVGRVVNTDELLGTDGFVGIKTGSMRAAGGCFMFRSVRRVHGERVVITGVVLGQPGRNLVTAGQESARHLVHNRLAHLD